MRIVKENTENLISLDKVGKDHLVVFIADGKPHIFTTQGYDIDMDADLYTPVCLSFGGVPLAEYIFCEYSLKSAIEYIEDFKLEVFESKDWKKALQWLIDNSE